jgi:hypothetical protein
VRFDFNANKKVAKIEDVPESFRGLYKETADKTGFELRNDDPGITAAVNAVTGLNAALLASRQEADEAKKIIAAAKVDLTPLQEFGTDPSSIAAAVKTKLQQMQEMVAQGAKVDVEGQLKKLREEMAKAHGIEMDAVKKSAVDLQGQLESVLVDSQITNAVAQHPGADPELVQPFVRKYVKVVIQDGRRRAVVVDGAGSTQYSMKNAGQEMGIPELVENMKKDAKYARLFPSTAPSGGGTPSAHSGPGNPNIIQSKTGSVNSTDKIQAGLAARRGGN